MQNDNSDFSDFVYKLLVKVDNDFIPPLSSSVDLNEYSKKISSKSKMFTQVQDGLLVGLCAIYATNRVNLEAYLTMLAVDSDYRGLGIAKKLILQMEYYVSLEGFSSIKLEVYKTNSNALLMYKKLGYEICGESDKSFFLQKSILN